MPTTLIAPSGDAGSAGPDQAEIRRVDIHRLQMLLGRGSGRNARVEPVEVGDPETDPSFQLDFTLQRAPVHGHRLEPRHPPCRDRPGRPRGLDDARRAGRRNGEEIEGTAAGRAVGAHTVRRTVRMIRLLRKVAFWEATFFVVLCLAWVVTLTGYKFTGGWQTALVIVGFTHGCVFTAYCSWSCWSAPGCAGGCSPRSASWWPA